MVEWRGAGGGGGGILHQGHCTSPSPLNHFELNVEMLTRSSANEVMTEYVLGANWKVVMLF